MPISNEVLDQILKDYEKPEDLLSENGLLQQLSKTLVERVLSGEIKHPLGYEKHSPSTQIHLMTRRIIKSVSISSRNRNKEAAGNLPAALKQTRLLSGQVKAEIDCKTLSFNLTNYFARASLINLTYGLVRVILSTKK